MRFRPITADEIDQVAAFQARAFLGNASDSRARIENNSRYTWRDIFAVEAGGQMAGCLFAFPLDLWLSGVPLKALAIAGVAVPAEQRRRGVAKFMVRQTHAHFRPAGFHIAILYPFAYGFYRALGYEIAEWRHYYRVPPAALKFYPEWRGVRLAEPPDGPDIRAAYDAYLRQRGGVWRSEDTWIERFHKREAELVAYEDETGLRGYLQYELKWSSGAGSETSWVEMTVREMVATTERAERGLLGFLAAQQEQVAAVKLVRAPDEPLVFGLAEPGAFPERRLEFIMRETYQGAGGMMLRVLDIPGAFAARRYPAFVSGAVTLAVDDPEQPGAGPWRIAFADGHAAIEPAEGGAQVATDIATLSGLFAGSLKASTARRLARLTGPDDAVALLDAALAVPPLLVQRTDWF